MFFLKDGEGPTPTTLQVSDRIRIRPRLSRFFFWRPRKKFITVAGLQIEVPVGGWKQLWTLDEAGAYVDWLALPRDTDEGLDFLQRIIALHGADNFYTPTIRQWVPEYPDPAVDGRFDYVAVGSFTPRVVT